MKNDILVRPANEQDIPAVEKMESTVWSHTGAELFHAAHFRAWLKNHPEGFIVAECEQEIIGDAYFFVQTIDPTVPESVLPYYQAFANGYGDGQHHPKGDAVFIANIASLRAGGGSQMLKYIVDYTCLTGRRWTYGGVRMPGFRDFLKTLPSSAYPKSTEELNDLAAFYAISTARLANIPLGTPLAKKTYLAFEPAPTTIDPSLGRIIQGHGRRLENIIPNYITDPPSLNYAGLVIFENQNFPGDKNGKR